MEQVIQVLRDQQISVLEPGQADYSQAIATSNLLFRSFHPECVVQPKSAAQVQTIIREARARAIKVTIKSNGPSYAGHSTTSSGILLDLCRMKKAKFDRNSMMITMDAGCLWSDVYEKLVIAKCDGFVVNGSRCPTADVSGFVLGGGLGPFTRSLGMGADALAEASLVVANGSLITVKETDPPASDKGRLFWALRGAGAGNFGVVVQMKLRVQKLSSRIGTVVSGACQWFPKAGFTDDVMATIDDFYTKPWPNKLTINTTWTCDPQQTSNDGSVRFDISFNGSKKDYDGIINKHISYPELRTHLKQRVFAEKSTRYLGQTLMAQWQQQQTEGERSSKETYQLRTSFIFSNSSPSILATITAAIRDLMETFRKDFNGKEANFLVEWMHAGGKASKPKPTDAAFFWRKGGLHCHVTLEWAEEWIEDKMRRFLALVKRTLRPLSLNKEAASVNFPDRDIPTKSHEGAYFGGNKKRLRKVKRKWDPKGLFNPTQGVRRPGEPEEDDDEDTKGEQHIDKSTGEPWKDGHWKRQWTHFNEDDIDDDFKELADSGYGE